MGAGHNVIELWRICIAIISSSIPAPPPFNEEAFVPSKTADALPWPLALRP